MKKIELEKHIEELKELVNHQKRVIDILFEFAPLGVHIPYSPHISDETCPMGGMHQYLTFNSAGWTCRCGKSAPIGFPVTTTSDNTGD